MPAAAAPAPDGSLIRLPEGAIFRVAGGAPLWISRCDYSGGCAGVINVPNLDEYRDTPRDGTLVRNVDSGAVHRFAGGAPLWISHCEYLPTGGCSGFADVDGHTFATLDHMRPYPADGTFLLNVDSGVTHRVAGGAALPLTDCAPLGGCPDAVKVDQGSITSRNYLRPAPEDGTVLRGMPSGQAWTYRDGRLAPRTDWAGSVELNDQSLTAFTSPEVGVTINDAAQYTRERDVQLSISAPPGATGVRIAGDGGFVQPVDRMFSGAGTLPWTLESTGPERSTRVVYVRFTGLGIDDTRQYSDDIILDEKPPQITRARARVLTCSGRYVMRVTASDALSGVAEVGIIEKPGAARQVVPYSDGTAEIREKVPARRVRGRSPTLSVDVVDAVGNASKAQRVRMLPKKQAGGSERRRRCGSGRRR